MQSDERLCDMDLMTESEQKRSEKTMREVKTDGIGCIVMASGLSRRYGKNKLLENLDGKEVIRHTCEHLRAAGLKPVTVTRSEEVKALLEKNGFRCILHVLPLKSDTIHIGLENLRDDFAGYLFMPGDQPLVRPETIKKMADRFLVCRKRALRLGFGNRAGSPVIFPASLRGELMTYQGDRGGIEVLRQSGAPCGIVQASFEWELWDVDTPEKMEQVRRVRI